MQPQHFPDFAHGQPDICHSALPTKPSIVPPLTRVAATSNSCSQCVETLFFLPWNRHSLCRGIRVFFAVESVFTLAWNNHIAWAIVMCGSRAAPKPCA
jgi:hypothetical protein